MSGRRREALTEDRRVPVSLEVRGRLRREGLERLWCPGRAGARSRRWGAAAGEGGTAWKRGGVMFGGETFDPGLDGARPHRQLDDVRNFTLGGGWLPLEIISNGARLPVSLRERPAARSA
jgi:hypothetical protein